MLSHRTTARGVLLLIVAAISAAAVSATPARSAPDTPPIVFPLVGDMPFYDNYGDPRGNGRHAGIDIEAPRRTPVVAAEDGKIKWWNNSSLAGCMLYLYGRSGTTYLYIHLNNDRTLENDNRGGCVKDVAYAVEDGARVTAGQQIGWNGDSGDAEGNPHLHFEVHPNDGDDVNPMPYLRRATRTLFPARIGTRFSVALRGTPISAGGGRITLKVAAVRWWPGGRWTPLGSRLVQVAVKRGAEIDSTLAAPVAGAAARDLSSRQEETYTLYTAPARATAAALRGEPGALVAARISRPGGKLVPVDAGGEGQPKPKPKPKPPADADPDPDDGEWTPPWEQDGIDDPWTPPFVQGSPGSTGGE